MTDLQRHRQLVKLNTCSPVSGNMVIPPLVKHRYPRTIEASFCRMPPIADTNSSMVLISGMEMVGVLVPVLVLIAHEWILES